MTVVRRSVHLLLLVQSCAAMLMLPAPPRSTPARCSAANINDEHKAVRLAVYNLRERRDSIQLQLGDAMTQVHVRCITHLAFEGNAESVCA